MQDSMDDSLREAEGRQDDSEVSSGTTLGSSTPEDSGVTAKLRKKYQMASALLRRELEELSVYDAKTAGVSGRSSGSGSGGLALLGGRFHVAPLRIPARRRLQTLVVAWHTSSFIYMTVLVLFLAANPLMWWFMVPYMVYYVWNRSPANGGVVRRYSPRLRSLALWRYYCEYYPISLHKSEDLAPTFVPDPRGAEPREWKLRLWLWPTRVELLNLTLQWTRARPQVATGPRYIFGYHPHGVGALGAFGAIATEGCNWSKVFAGIPACLCTLVNQFQIPIYRDYLLGLGCTSVARKNVLKVLEQNYSVCIVVGGAQEALLSRVGSTELVLNKRKGFIKLALETGNVNLVPIYAFGETDCFNVLDTGNESYLRKFQLWIKKTYGFTIPFFFARGVFNYDFGFLPFRNPINVVVGKPVYVDKRRTNPTMEEIDHYHDLYVQELRNVFDKNKHKFGYAGKELKIVE
ncbi:ACR140Cp [Eremothecium gossypii ATCC 10895]|uniref:Diacylglycerol O-acyltransferase 1 n=1 Tax=Eremothecium gossypii (strain ATCC 10895 / CBS 109.51 / FGSC 9923 / NRRL Y-1056) TaxID=284811 RepID=DGAT2_EREGS|nr:ACR140Cp [Eremothecium gossypii ATCC 10895]Q75BY0.1 RecName: Full=Diacylglycerol O-acyltransferase 1 [Eremothecium gossypii ATCC 10895]AAS51366.1 ACR140Cp [Eremothecium gossypii ATCC 10895]AEY95657.1 FACR140Cp [Eremothecium gossypii FDAG1]